MHISESCARLSPCLCVSRRRRRHTSRSRWDFPRANFGHSFRVYAHPSKVCLIFNIAPCLIITGTSNSVLSSCSAMVCSLPYFFTTNPGKRDINLTSDLYISVAWPNLLPPFHYLRFGRTIHCITWTQNTSQLLPTHSQPLYLFPKLRCLPFTSAVPASISHTFITKILGPCS